MKIHLHKNAKTTPAQRAFIQNDTEMHIADLALKIGVSETTVRKWKKRSFVFDRPHTPKTISTTLTPAQELALVFIRICLRAGLDDLVDVARQFISPACSRSGLNRCLKRYHISRLPRIPEDESMNLKDYRGVYLYYKRIYFNGLPGLKKPFFIQTLLDCSFRTLYADMDMSPLTFVKKTVALCPPRVLGLVFTDPIFPGGGGPDVKDKADARRMKEFCQEQGMIFRHVRTESPGTLKAIQDTCACMGKAANPFQAGGSKPGFFNLQNKVNTYNTRMAQRALKSKTPNQAMGKHYGFFPGSFKINPKQSSGTFFPSKSMRP